MDDDGYIELDAALGEDNCIITSSRDPELHTIIIGRREFFEDFAVPDWWELIPIEDEELQERALAYRLTGVDHDTAAYLLQNAMGLPEETVQVEDITPQESPAPLM